MDYLISECLSVSPVEEGGGEMILFGAGLLCSGVNTADQMVACTLHKATGARLNRGTGTASTSQYKLVLQTESNGQSLARWRNDGTPLPVILPT